MGFKISASKICFLGLLGAFHDVIVDGYSIVRIGGYGLNISFLEESLMGMEEFWLNEIWVSMVGLVWDLWFSLVEELCDKMLILASVDLYLNWLCHMWHLITNMH